ncbi:MAG TPA: S-adenosylmethionine:tRNA ribosyltransferase-isomerase [Cyclobacteriaceae bacterium]|nr:S-adenosylmethionine:tRNA ribosyltransferase-isomerase [Cyclobacteriaceae bacterium]
MINIGDYTYHLPEERIASHPLPERDQSKLLVYQNGRIIHSGFSQLSGFIPFGSALFFNNTKVIPARLIFQKDTGASIELFLLDPIWPSPVVSVAMGTTQKSQWHCSIGNLRRWNENRKLHLTANDLTLSARLADRKNGVVEFNWDAPVTFSEVVEKLGATPLPPYIKRKTEVIDRTRYQTVYAKNDGAVAAPTAGLHFTERVMESLSKKNIGFNYLTLHVSAGTFQPVKVENASDHVMHREQIVVTRANLENLLKDETKVAVGTTSLRTVESIYWYGVKLMADPNASFEIRQDDPYRLKAEDRSAALQAVLKKLLCENSDQLIGETAIYILPGYVFRMADALITNFHQPRSTLMLLVAAFAGDDWKRIYDEALKHNYRFLSYGDSSLLFGK